MNKIYETIILGAPASGLMLGSMLKEDFLILEKNPKAGAKISISGGGRCNFTNEHIGANNYLGDKEFIESILSTFTTTDMLSIAKRFGVPFVLKKNNQFFCENSASELLNPILKNIDRQRISLNTEVFDAKYKNGVFEVETSKGSFFSKKFFSISNSV